MITQPRSGCGPGRPVPAGTPQHGTRSVPLTETEKIMRFNSAMDDVLDLWMNIDAPSASMSLMAKTLQRAADTAAALAGRDE